MSISETSRAGWRIARAVVAAESAGGIPAAWTGPYSSHAIEPAPAGAPDVEIRVRPVPGFQGPAFGEGDDLSFEDAPGRGGRRIRLARHDFAGALEEEGGRYRGEFEVLADGRLEPFNVLVRTCLSFVCEDRGDLQVHASGVLRSGRVWLFAGRSGLGKTTVATDLAAGGETFAVDQVVLRPGPGGTVEAFSTPFGDEEGAADRSREGPVAGICFLEQAAHHSAKRLSARESMARLLGCAVSFSRDPERARRTAEAVAAIAETAPCSLLRFRRDDSFWDLIDPPERAGERARAGGGRGVA